MNSAIEGIHILDQTIDIHGTNIQHWAGLQRTEELDHYSFTTGRSFAYSLEWLHILVTNHTIAGTCVNIMHECLVTFPLILAPCKISAQTFSSSRLQLHQFLFPITALTTHNTRSIMAPKAASQLFTLPPRFLCPNVSRIFLRTIKSIDKKPRMMNSKWNKGAGLPSMHASQLAAFERKKDVLPRRTGALLTKTGMTGMYDPITAERTPCTVLQLDRCEVTAHKTLDIHGYWAVQVGSGGIDARNVTRAELGHFAKAEVAPKRHVAEFRVRSEAGLVPVGTEITADLFVEGQFVDARATTKGKGFAGGMKRHGFAGQPASHGNSLTHRAMGSAGASQGSGSRVLPGKRMAGNMGGNRHTVQNLKIMKVDRENGIVVVAGAVPGPNRGIVHLQDAVMKQWPDAPAFPPVVAAEPAAEAVAG